MIAMAMTGLLLEKFEHGADSIPALTDYLGLSIPPVPPVDPDRPHWPVRSSAMTATQQATLMNAFDGAGIAPGRRNEP
jgi:hypothetical protein